MNLLIKESHISFIIRVFNAVGIFIFTPLLALWVIQTKDITLAEASIIVAVFTFVQKGGAVFAASLIDKLGIKSSLLIGLFGTAAVLFIINLISNFYLLILFITLLGILISLYNISLKTHISFLDEKSRITAFSMLNIALNIGASVGPVIGGWVFNWNPNNLMYISMIGFILAGMAACILKNNKSEKNEETENIIFFLKRNYRKKELYIFLRFLLFSGFFWFLYGHIFATFPVLMADYYSTGIIGIFYTINALTVIVTQSIFIKIKEKISGNKWYVISLILISISFLLIWISPTFIILILAVVLFSFAEIIWVPLIDNEVVQKRGTLSPAWAFAISGIIWGGWQSIANIIGLNLYSFFKEHTFLVLFGISLTFLTGYILFLVLYRYLYLNKNFSESI